MGDPLKSHFSLFTIHSLPKAGCQITSRRLGEHNWKPTLGILKPGYNGGLVLMHLRKLRSFNWKKTWMNSLNFLLRNMGALANSEQASQNPLFHY
ncbi:hypothetical protein EG68_04149 [Paragonimus skrjabini miyazakii]|uniref:Uncharacterized protein n=1 Tax=Paragonimus skrjabini miyazakii TaxID=59628 RepID=A0A8S9YYC3_9TREM|nr:hypothetical protein EG68_04149 [Paragonimus skrjabini miyazakii]